MKIKALYDPGSVSIEKAEDGFFAEYPFFVVADGVSGAYHPRNGPRIFKGRTGGQMAANKILSSFNLATPGDDLEDIVMKANRTVRRAQKDINVKDSDLLAGASFAGVKVTEKKLEIIQAGDCLAFALKWNGEIVATRNQLFLNDTEDREMVRRLMMKHGSDRNAMWAEYLPIFRSVRKQRINNPGDKAGFGLLNGQRKLQKCLQKITLPAAEVSRFLLASDGFFYYPESGNEETLGRKMFALYKQGGLGSILAYNRRKEEAEKNETHIDHAEATAIIIEL